MTAEALKREAERELTEFRAEGALGNAQVTIESQDHPEGVDLEVRVLLSWNSRLPVVVVQLGATFSAEADPAACARDLFRGVVEAALATVPVVKRFRRRRRGSLVE